MALPPWKGGPLVSASTETGIAAVLVRTVSGLSDFRPWTLFGAGLESEFRVHARRAGAPAGRPPGGRARRPADNRRGADRVGRGWERGPMVRYRPCFRHRGRRPLPGGAGGLDRPDVSRSWRAPPPRRPRRRLDLPGLPAPQPAPGRPRLLTSCRVRRPRPDLPAAVRFRRRAGSSAGTDRLEPDRAGLAPRPARPLLPRARKALAGRVHGQRSARPGTRARLSAPRPSHLPGPGPGSAARRGDRRRGRGLGPGDRRR